MHNLKLSVNNFNVFVSQTFIIAGKHGNSAIQSTLNLEMYPFFDQHGVVDRLVQGSMVVTSIFSVKPCEIFTMENGGPSFYLCAQHLRNICVFFHCDRIFGGRIIASF